MTKFINNTKNNKYKETVFKIYINGYGEQVSPTQFSPKDYEIVELVCEEYRGDYDLMFGYNDDENKYLYLGYWNDGC